MRLASFLAALFLAGCAADADRTATSELRETAGTHVRIMAANTTSGDNQSYDRGDGIKIFQGVKPDVVVIQEFNIGQNTQTDLRSFVDTTFGTDFVFYREIGEIPNGIISHWPLEQSGSWRDPRVSNRGFAWAKIRVPGPHPLWAVSLHLLTTGGGNRKAETEALVAQIKTAVPPEDYLVIGGDFNTGSRSEQSLTPLSEVVNVLGPYPADNRGNANTSSSRNKPHDWLLADPDLGAQMIPVELGGQSFPNGLVFDSRVFTPLDAVAPVEPSTSGAPAMQHMPVIKDFVLPASSPNSAPAPSP